MDMDRFGGAKVLEKVCVFAHIYFVIIIIIVIMKAATSAWAERLFDPKNSRGNSRLIQQEGGNTCSSTPFPICKHSAILNHVERHGFDSGSDWGLHSANWAAIMNSHLKIHDRVQLIPSSQSRGNRKRW